MELGVSPQKQQAKLEAFTKALQYLAKKELTTAAVIANFHQQRVIPLVERSLPIFELTPEAPVEGLRTSNELLSQSAAARRARSAVAQFPSNPRTFGRSRCAPRRGTLLW